MSSITTVTVATPRPWEFTKGGLENQCENTTNWIQTNHKQFNMRYLTNNGDRKSDIYHLYGSDYVFKDIAGFVKSFSIPLVVSSVFYSRYPQILAFYMRYFDKIFWRSYFGFRQKVIQSADIVLPNCDLEAQQIIDIFRIHPDKVKVIRNGVNPNFLDVYANIEPYPFFPDNEDFFLCISRIEPRKKIELAIEACLKESQKLVILGAYDPGNNHYFQKIKSLVRASSSQVKMLTGLNHRDLIFQAALKQSKAHVLASVLETPGLVNLEYGLSGKPVICSRLGTIIEYLESYPIYFSPGSVGELRKAIREALTRTTPNPGQIDLIKKEFQWESIANQVANVYRTLS